VSLITRCPACTTLFRVVPDQLRISDGWVRCGQCDEVFDANAALQSEAVVAEAPPIAPAQAVLPESEQRITQGFFQNESALSAVGSAFTVAPESDARNAINIPAEDTFFQQSPVELNQESPAALKQLPEDDFDIGPSFMRASQTKSKSPKRFALGFVCLLLAAVFLGQILMQERDRLAATQPLFQSGLQSLCSIAGCEIAPVRQIESVVIESSSFTKVRADVYRVNVTLKNTSQIELAIPSLELTLTDPQDQISVRRIFDANALAPSDAVMLAGSEISASLPISIAPQIGNQSRVAGYRLLVFYP
jgi:predicted Zn finger-like uncharacterized protein